MATSHSTQGCGCPGPLRESVLTLDGGGIRGYSSLIILRQLMIEARDYEHELDQQLENSDDDDEVDDGLPLPCHYFGYMFGTSTGGIIALMLGRMRMTVKQCIDVYKKLGTDVFRKKRPLRFNQYSHRKLEALMKQAIHDHCSEAERYQADAAPLLDPTNSLNGNGRSRQHRTRLARCAVGVVATRRGQRSHKPHIFRSYHNPCLAAQHTTSSHVEESAKLHNLASQSEVETPTILEAARATSAAPHYFKEANIDCVDYIDGGVVANNPAFIAWHEVAFIHQHLSEGRCHDPTGGIKVLVSIGTGRRAPHNIFSDGNIIQRILGLIRAAFEKLTDPDSIHEHMLALCPSSQQSASVYHRLNVENGLENMALDACNMSRKTNITLTTIEECTRDYLQEIHRELRQLARLLVDHRRSKCVNPRYHGLSGPGPLTDLGRFRNLHDMVNTGASSNGRMGQHQTGDASQWAEMPANQEAYELPGRSANSQRPGRHHTWG